MKKTFRTRTYEIHTDKLKNGHKVRFAFLTDLHGLSMAIIIRNYMTLF